MHAGGGGSLQNGVKTVILVQIADSPNVTGGVCRGWGMFLPGRCRNTISYQHPERGTSYFWIRLLSEVANLNREVGFSGLVLGFTTEFLW